MRKPRVLVLRPADHAEVLAARLQTIGMDPVVVSAVAIHPPASWEEVDAALGRLASYDWVLFTSASGVCMFFARRRAQEIAGSLPAAARWAAIGPGTAAALVAEGVPGPWVPSQYRSEEHTSELQSRPPLVCRHLPVK